MLSDILAMAAVGSGLVIADVVLAPAAILDARGLPDPASNRGAIVLISPDARDPRLAAALRRVPHCVVAGVDVPCRVTPEATIELTGYPDLAHAVAAARAIAGKDPLPDALDE